MMREIIVTGFLVVLLFSAGSIMLGSWLNQWSEAQPEEKQCVLDDDCGVIRDYIGMGMMIYTACVDGVCTEVECIDDFGCRRLGSFGSVLVCVNHECVSRIGDCIQIAKSDYNMTLPKCIYYGATCECTDYIIDSPEQRIKLNNSIRVIRERKHAVGEPIEFEIKKG